MKYNISLSKLFLLLIAIAIYAIVLFFLSKKKNKRHIYNINLSKKLLIKINSFSNSGQKINYLRKINPFVFEELLLSAFEKKGYQIKRNKKYTGDGGVDGIVFKEKQKYLIQAKRYSSYINLSDLKKFEQLIIKKQCKGFFIHTGKTGNKTYTNFNSKIISIISGNKLIDLLNPNHIMSDF
ncbi:MAG TPA: restriction endonuclease [Crocinitomix sp.]|nr:restriction endonuclease [Bacteroidia bacterium]HIP36316.1 restriction endonuclease [Crocinitomix sp.]